RSRASRSAVAGAITTRSASWPRRTWATSSTSSKTEVRTGWWLSASQVAAPTNSREERVGTTRTSAPSPTRPRTRCAVLYAAMPPPTPTRPRAPSRARSSLLVGPTGGGPGSEREVGRRDLGGVVAEQQRGRGVGIRLVLRGVLLLVDLADREQVLVDLAQRDRERLLLVLDVHERADELQQALGELRVVRVDLASALGGVQHQGVLRVDGLEQTVDRGVRDGFGLCDCSGHGCPFVRYDVRRSRIRPSPGGGEGAGGGAQVRSRTPSRRASASAARSTVSLTMVTSNSSSAASSTRAVASRRSRSSASSVPRPTSRSSRGSQRGGARNTQRASGRVSRTCRAPYRSISSSTGRPSTSFCWSGPRGVPYLLRRCTTAHSSIWPLSSREVNSSSLTKR